VGRKIDGTFVFLRLFFVLEFVLETRHITSSGQASLLALPTPTFKRKKSPIFNTVSFVAHCTFVDFADFFPHQNTGVSYGPKKLLSAFPEFPFFLFYS